MLYVQRRRRRSSMLAEQHQQLQRYMCLHKYITNFKVAHILEANRAQYTITVVMPINTRKQTKQKHIASGRSHAHMSDKWVVYTTGLTLALPYASDARNTHNWKIWLKHCVKLEVWLWKCVLQCHQLIKFCLLVYCQVGFNNQDLDLPGTSCSCMQSCLPACLSLHSLQPRNHRPHAVSWHQVPES